MLREQPTRKLVSSTTNNSNRPVVVASLDEDAASRGVDGVTLPGVVEMN